MRNARALDPSTQRNDDTSFCTLRVPSTHVQRSVSHWVQEEDLAPSAPLPRHHPHHPALDHVLLLGLLDLVLPLELLDPVLLLEPLNSVLSLELLDSPVLQVQTQPATPRF